MAGRTLAKSAIDASSSQVALTIAAPRGFTAGLGVLLQCSQQREGVERRQLVDVDLTQPREETVFSRRGGREQRQLPGGKRLAAAHRGPASARQFVLLEAQENLTGALDNRRW